MLLSNHCCQTKLFFVKLKLNWSIIARRFNCFIHELQSLNYSNLCQVGYFFLNFFHVSNKGSCVIRLHGFFNVYLRIIYEFSFFFLNLGGGVERKRFGSSFIYRFYQHQKLLSLSA